MCKVRTFLLKCHLDTFMLASVPSRVRDGLTEDTTPLLLVVQIKAVCIRSHISYSLLSTISSPTGFPASSSRHWRFGFFPIKVAAICTKCLSAKPMSFLFEEQKTPIHATSPKKLGWLLKKTQTTHPVLLIFCNSCNKADVRVCTLCYLRKKTTTSHSHKYKARLLQGRWKIPQCPHS